MQRRKFLTVAGTTVTATLAGCVDSSDDPEADDDPEGVVEEYMTLVDDGDVEGLQSITHSESPMTELYEGESAAAIRDFAEQDITLDSMEIVEDGEAEVIINVTTTARLEDNEFTQSSDIELRREDDEMNIWRDDSFDDI